MSSPTFDVLTQAQIIRAGAGAGKTTTLISTFIDFCNKYKQEHNKLPHVVITTFTRKATQEIKERLLIKALDVDDHELFHHINKKHSVHISTIHGLLTIFLNQNADLLGLPIDLKITNSLDEKNKLRKIIKNLLKNQTHYYELLEHYRFSQITDLTLKLIEFLREVPQAEFITSKQLQTISNLKKDFLILKLDQIFKEIGDKETEWKNKLTEKGFEAWFLYLTELKSFYQLIKEGKLVEALQVYEELPDKPRMGIKNSGFSEAASLQLKEFLDEFDLGYSDTLEYQDLHFKTNTLFFDLVKQAQKNLLEQKKLTGEITINDLELFSLELITNYPQSIARFQQDWDYFMIDEYQDTSPLQVKILDQLIQGKPYFIVGDPQQSIYLFRGARSEVFFQKENIAIEFPEELKLNYLQTNYRSEPSLMHFMNDYFEQLSPQFKKMSVREQSEMPRSMVQFVDCEDQTNAALHKIFEMVQQGVALKDICVLSRKNEPLVNIAREARKFHIPVQLQVATGFSSRREILDLSAFLKFLVNPYDNENLVLLLRSPWFFISDDDIYKLRRTSGALWSQLAASDSTIEVYKKLQNFILSYKSIGASSALFKFVTEVGFLDVSNAYDPSGKREANFWKFFDQLKKSEQRTGFLLAEFLSTRQQELNEDLGSAAGEADPVIQPNCVNLMSIHASKGLQFPYVIVIGFSDKANITLFEYLSISNEEQTFSLAPFVTNLSRNLPSSWAIAKRREFNQKELSEHERFLYVALTRAQKELVLISEKAKKYSSSWRQLGFWPEEGLHEKENYDILSVLHEQKLETNQKTDRSKIQVREKFQQNDTTTTPNQLSVTSTLEDKIEKNSKATETTPHFENLIKAQQGTDLHRLFESLKYNSLEELSKKVTADQMHLIQRLNQETQLPLKSILQNGHTEMGFGLKTKSGVLQGQIDLWGIVGREVYIIDYKIGRSEFQAKAFEQLAVYTLCLQQMKLISNENPIHLIAWYVSEEKLIKKTYKNFQDFTQQIPSKILEMFGG